MSKKIICLVLFLALAAGFLAPVSLADEKKISVVATIFPIYDWVREIVSENDNVQITLLLDSGVDLHSYQPTAVDIMKIAACDVFIYVGGESDDWVENVLREAVAPNMIVIDLLEAMGDEVKAEEIIEGMEHEDHDEDEHDRGEHDEDHHHEHEDEADEHVWLSLRNAQKLVNVISSHLAEADPAHAESYRDNASAYNQRLSELDREYEQAVSEAAFHTMLFGDRFPFRYMADDYGLSYYAAFSGCSAETEASFQTVVFLAQKTDELGLKTVLTIEGTDHRIAETIVAATDAKDQKILTLDSMQGCTMRDVRDGVTYLSVMQKNLEALKQALN
ncbi:MAG: zinc ABC transporter substrate-binding protein [Clostridia bacterium]|nr:zinc ABC transporter substrate-binding protein [Clostridia bacterium]MBR6088462.1 zinc ABC transporter substrate-binding protein [Anaerolineaceae bacterium]